MTLLWIGVVVAFLIIVTVAVKLGRKKKNSNKGSDIPARGARQNAGVFPAAAPVNPQLAVAISAAVKQYRTSRGLPAFTTGWVVNNDLTAVITAAVNKYRTSN
jgi:Na+-transporting methylmalonyl-CoA/oxaloacetate decarboxylase gamma subunit